MTNTYNNHIIYDLHLFNNKKIEVMKVIRQLRLYNDIKQVL